MVTVDYRKPGAYSREAEAPGTPAPFFRPAIVALLGRVMERSELTTAALVSSADSFMTDDATPLLRYRCNFAYNRVVDDDDFVVATNAEPPVEYDKNTDYTVDFYAGTITLITIDPPDPTDSTTWLQVTYNHLPKDFYKPQDFFDYDDVVEFYGDPLDIHGEIQSPLVLAAGFTLRDAPWIRTFPIDPSCGDIPDHEDTEIGTDDWEYTIDQKLAISDVDIVVGLYELDQAGYQNGENGVLNDLMDSHLEDMCSETGRMERVWLWSDMYGLDLFGDATWEPNMHVEDHPWGMLREEEIFVGPPGVDWFNYRKINPVTNRAGVLVPLDGNYMCAYLAGMLAGNDPQMPLTFKRTTNFKSLGDEYKEDEMNTLAAKGCTVMEPHAWGLRVRHGVTCSLEDLESTEISVVRSKHYMCKYLRTRLEDTFVGQPINKTTFLSIASMTYAMLILLRDAGTIYDFRNVKARSNPNRPTEVVVKYEYCPAYPLNYIIIEFTINPQLLTSQSAEALAESGELGTT